MVRTKKNILSKCFSFVTHGVCYFTTFVSSPVPLQRQLGTTSDLIWTMLTWYNRWMVSFVDTSLVFLFTGKLNQILTHSRASGNTGFRLDFKTVTSKLSKKKMWRHRKQFLSFITINNISTPIFNWKIAAILFVSVIDYFVSVIDYSMQNLIWTQYKIKVSKI